DLADMKAMDATWVDMLMRFKKSGYHPKRTIKLALTCGEETTNAFNGAQWLAKKNTQVCCAAMRVEKGGGGRGPYRRKWQVARGIDTGRREGGAEIPSGDGQRRRPQLRAHSR